MAAVVEVGAASRRQPGMRFTQVALNGVALATAMPPALIRAGNMVYVRDLDVFYVRVAGVSGATPSWKIMPSGGLVQSVYKTLAADSSTVANVYSTLLSQSITTSGGVLIIQAAITAQNSNANVHGNIFAIVVDNVLRQNAGFTSSGANHHSAVGMITRVTGLAAGVHTVEIQWKTDAFTLLCNPVTSEDDTCDLLIQEVTV